MSVNDNTREGNAIASHIDMIAVYICAMSMPADQQDQVVRNIPAALEEAIRYRRAEIARQSG